MAKAKVGIPMWASVEKDSRGSFVLMFSDIVYPLYIEALQDAKVPAKENRFWAEVSRRCATKYLKESGILAKNNNRLVIRASEENYDDGGVLDPDYKWKLSNLPGTVDDEIQGAQMFRPFYKRIKESGFAF